MLITTYLTEKGTLGVGPRYWFLLLGTAKRPKAEFSPGTTCGLGLAPLAPTKDERNSGSFRENTALVSSLEGIRKNCRESPESEERQTGWVSQRGSREPGRG